MSNEPSGAAHGTAADWITLWQSECAARALDRDTREVFLAAIAQLGDAAQLIAAALPAARRERGSAAGTDAPPGPAPVVASSGARDIAMAELERRVAELERRLAHDDGRA